MRENKTKHRTEPNRTKMSNSSSNNSGANDEKHTPKWIHTYLLCVKQTMMGKNAFSNESERGCEREHTHTRTHTFTFWNLFYWVKFLGSKHICFHVKMWVQCGKYRAMSFRSSCFSLIDLIIPPSPLPSLP